jgi:DNA-binding transcriptional LysR family regulator
MDLPTCAIETDDPAWLDFWLLNDLRDGRPPRLGPVAASYDGVLAAIAAGEGIGFPPAGAKAFGSGAPVVGVPVDGLPDATLAVAWPLDGHNPLTEGFVKLAADLAQAWRPGSPGPDVVS